MPPVRKLLKWALALAIFYAAYEIVPPYFRAYVFHDEIVQISNQATFDNGKAERSPELSHYAIEDGARDEVLLRARDHGIALDPQHLHIMRDGIKVIIEAEYTVHVDLVVRQLDLTFQVSSERR